VVAVGTATNMASRHGGIDDEPCEDHLAAGLRLIVRWAVVEGGSLVNAVLWYMSRVVAADDAVVVVTLPDGFARTMAKFVDSLRGSRFERAHDSSK